MTDLADLADLRTIADVERRAAEVMPGPLFDTLFGHVGDPHWPANHRNVAAYEAFALRPRVLAGAGDRSLRTAVLGHQLALPVIVGPAGGLDNAHPEAEVAAARAAAAAGTVYVVPNTPARSFEEIAAAAVGPRWYQVFVHRDRAVTEFLIGRARETGCSALVLTVSNVGAHLWRHEVPPGRPGLDLDAPAPVLAGFPRSPVPSVEDLRQLIDPSVSWSDLAWLRSVAGLPLVVKGIQTAEDARLCIEHGVDGIVVSNHGGRFLQATRGTVESLPEVVDAVEGRVEVLLDGGIRQGADILKALALGARAVLIGRATFWGLAAAGERGLGRVLEILAYELDAAMGLCGVADPSRVSRSLVCRQTVWLPPPLG